MKQILRWLLIIFIALVLGLVFVLISLGIESAQMQLILMFALWIGTWMGGGIYLKNKRKDIAQPFAWAFMYGMGTAVVFIYMLKFLVPSEADLLAKAQEAEQNYFMLSMGSLDHSRICKEARTAYKNYYKIGNEEKARMFKYIIMEDKCL